MFFYRYANHMGHDTSVPSNFDLENEGYSDLDDIASYARDAVEWSVYKGLIRGTSASDFAPNAYMARKWFANVLAYYSQRIEGFIFCVDSYSFANSSASFSRSDTNGSYYINNTDRQRLIQAINSRSGANSVYLTNVLNYLSSTFDDTDEDGTPDFACSCFGMAVSGALDKVGKINLNSRTSNPSGMLYDMPSPLYNESIESAINYYQVLQNGQDLNFGKIVNQYVDRVYEFVETIDNEGPVVFKYSAQHTALNGEVSPVNHAIIIYKYSEGIVPGIYTFYAYDSRFPNDEIELPLFITNSGDMDFRLVHPDDSEEVISAWAQYQTLNLFDPYDIDGYDNKGSFSSETTSASLEYENLAELNDDTMLLYIYSNSFSLEDAEGNVLHCDEGITTGNMEILARSLIVSDGVRATWCFMVNKDNYSISALDDDQVSVFALTSSKFYGVCGKDFEGVSLNQGGAVTVECECADYEVVNMSRTEFAQ